jgi:hypothetical protein
MKKDNISNLLNIIKENFLCFVNLQLNSVSMNALNLNICIKRSFLTLLIAIGLFSCQYETIEVDLPDPNEPVSFTSGIIPIFTNNNNCTACHGSGATAPDLTAERAYNSIVPALINTENPENSRIYQFPHPSSATHGFKKYTHVQAALVLAWITQGAENN